MERIFGPNASYRSFSPIVCIRGMCNGNYREAGDGEAEETSDETNDDVIEEGEEP